METIAADVLHYLIFYAILLLSMGFIATGMGKESKGFFIASMAVVAMPYVIAFVVWATIGL